MIDQPTNLKLGLGNAWAWHKRLKCAPEGREITVNFAVGATLGAVLLTGSKERIILFHEYTSNQTNFYLIWRSVVCTVLSCSLAWMSFHRCSTMNWKGK